MTAMNPYQMRSTEGLSGLELSIALYDGIIRFLYRAIEAVENGDVGRRRAEVKRALDIIIHLQATLRMDIGGQPAQALSEFYASVFAQILQASQSASKAKFEHAVHCVKNVRDAWREISQKTDVDSIPPGPAAPAAAPNAIEFNQAFREPQATTASHWNA